MRSLIVLAVLGSSATAAPKDAITFVLNRETWMVTARGATHTRQSKYDHQITTKAWTIEIRDWPTSKVFIQTLDEELEAMERKDPGLVVLRKEARAKADWLLVVEKTDKSIHGIVMRPGTSASNALCSFTVTAPASVAWAKPLAACRSLERTRRARISVRVPEVQPRIERAQLVELG